MFPFGFALLVSSSLSVAGLDELGSFLGDPGWNWSWTWSWCWNDDSTDHDWSWRRSDDANVSDSSNSSLYADNLSNYLSDLLLDDDNLLLDDRSLVNWSSLVSSSEDDDLSSEDSDLFLVDVNLLDKADDDLLVFDGYWSWSWTWSWETWSWEVDRDNISSDDVSFTDDGSDSLSQNDNLLVDLWLLIDWSIFVLLDEDNQLLSDHSDLGDVLSDSLLEDFDNLNLTGGEWLWNSVNWPNWSWVLDDGDNTLELLDSLGDLDLNLSQSFDLLDYDDLLLFGGGLELDCQFLDSLSNDCDLLGELDNLFPSNSDVLNISLRNSWNSDWSDDLENEGVASVGLFGDLLEFLLEVLELISEFFGFLLLDLLDDFRDLLLDFFDLSIELVALLSQWSDNSLLNLSELSDLDRFDLLDNLGD